MVDNHFVKSVEFIKSAVRPKDYPETAWPEIAVAGRSNVGKSSLINRLVNRKQIARVSNTPGRTQLLNFFLVNQSFVLCDLPGYGFAKVPKKVKRAWGPMVETYLSERPQVRALLLLMDVRRTPGDWEMQLIQWASLHGYTLVPVVTKVDKLSVSKRKPAVAKVARAIGVSADQVIPWSSMSGEGLSELWRTIQRFVQPPA